VSSSKILKLITLEKLSIKNLFDFKKYRKIVIKGINRNSINFIGSLTGFIKFFGLSKFNKIFFSLKGKLIYSHSKVDITIENKNTKKAIVFFFRY
jgi:hypothetical protein